MQPACFFSLTSFSQHETDNWFFGNHAAVSFSTGQVQPVGTSQMNQHEGSASVSDPQTGELLFYTDGVSIWNRNHAFTPNGNALSGSSTSTQSALIVPNPANSDQYYVFTVDANGGGAGFRYSIMDMTLEAGLGDVIPATKNTPVLTPVSEKLTAVPHTNGTDYWILVHQWDSDAFYVYPLTAAGLGMPVISHTGAIHSQTAGEVNADAAGCLKPSPDGTMLISCVYSVGPREVELFDFDAVTGIVSNALPLFLQSRTYSASFSPDNSKLYIQPLDGNLLQFDLTGSDWEIVNSVHIYETTIVGESLQLATDGAIYLSSSGNHALHRINFPNLPGDACMLEANVVNLGNGTCTLGLPNFMQYHFNGIESELGLAGAPQHELNAFPNPVNRGECIHINWPETVTGPVHIRVTDERGTEVASSNFSQVPETVTDLAALAAGVYFLTVESDSHSYTTRIVFL